MAPKIKVLIAAGGSGGHLFPAQQLSQMLESDCEILFAGYKLASSPFFASTQIAHREIKAAPLKRGFFRAAWKGFWQSVSLLKSYNPSIVVGFGSYHTFPLLLAAALMGKKLILFEANSSLGKVTRFFAPFAKKIAVQFPIGIKKEELVPLLPWGLRQEVKISKQEARAHFGLDPNKTTILVFGGSQGAAFLNQTVPLAIDRIQEEVQVIHLSGKGGKAFYHTKSYVNEFEKEMSFIYAAADVAICRSGAGTVAELIQYKIPALFIPFPAASEDHQWKNGQFFVEETRGARILRQSEATLERLTIEIEALLNDKETLLSNLKKYNLNHKKRTELGSLVRMCL